MGVGVLLCALAILDVQTKYVDRILPGSRIQQAQSTDAILVLGASVLNTGEPSDALRDRLLTAIDLIHAKKAPVILISGDDGGFHQNEITVMSNFLFSQGIATSTVRIDGEGYRTYESCKNTVSQGIHSAIIVTQRFHLARALYICNELGIESQGVIADRQSYRRILFFWSRDILASVKAWFDVNVYVPASPLQ